MNLVLVIFAILVMAHGLIHLSYAAPMPMTDTPEWPFRLRHSWLLAPIGLDRLARPLGILLGIVTVAGFVLAGLGLMGVPWLSEAWQTLMLIGAAASAVLLILFWDRRLILGLMIDAVLLVALLWNQSPLSGLAQWLGIF